jgi:hypothetical protein
LDRVLLRLEWEPPEEVADTRVSRNCPCLPVFGIVKYKYPF